MPGDTAATREVDALRREVDGIRRALEDRVHRLEDESGDYDTKYDGRTSELRDGLVELRLKYDAAKPALDQVMTIAGDLAVLKRDTSENTKAIAELRGGSALERLTAPERLRWYFAMIVAIGLVTGSLTVAEATGMIDWFRAAPAPLPIPAPALPGPHPTE